MADSEQYIPQSLEGAKHESNGATYSAATSTSSKMLQAQEGEPKQPLRAGAMLPGIMKGDMLDAAAKENGRMQTGCQGACLAAPC